jgi:hypothetical protein
MPYTSDAQRKAVWASKNRMVGARMHKSKGSYKWGKLSKPAAETLAKEYSQKGYTYSINENKNGTFSVTRYT